MAFPSPLLPQPTPLPANWLGAVSQIWWAAQGVQWQALTAWQQAATAMQQEMWDEWSARWAGSARLDD